MWDVGGCFPSESISPSFSQFPSLYLRHGHFWLLTALCDPKNWYVEVYRGREHVKVGVVGALVLCNRQSLAFGSNHHNRKLKHILPRPRQLLNDNPPPCAGADASRMFLSLSTDTCFAATLSGTERKSSR